jgi:cell wall-associated NlpC family hydrolase
MTNILIMVFCMHFLGAFPLTANANAMSLSPDAIAEESQSNFQNSDATLVPPHARLTNLLIYAISMVGVKYKFGGNAEQSGFDCSGFVRYVFSESIPLELPRSSYAMGKLGKAVKSDDLQAGDLVFYNTLQRAFSHVGIYLGEGRFIHSPSRGKSVEIVDMSDRYWKKRFNGARRLVADE